MSKSSVSRAGATTSTRSRRTIEEGLNMSEGVFASVPELVAEVAAGRMVVLVDDENRENEGDVILAADDVTPEAIAFMARFCRGLICLTLTPEKCDELQLRPMVP